MIRDFRILCFDITALLGSWGWVALFFTAFYFESKASIYILVLIFLGLLFNIADGVMPYMYDVLNVDIVGMKRKERVKILREYFIKGLDE